MKKGIVLIALGNPCYGKLAYNLAVSIRHSDKDTPIAIIYNNESLSFLFEHEKMIFNEMIKAPQESYMLGGQLKYLMCKTHLYDLSPFNETIFLDADTLWLPKKPAYSLFDELKEVDFTMINEGFYDIATNFSNCGEEYTYWAKVQDIKKAYSHTKGFSTGKLYQYRSELIYFKRTKANRDFFSLAKKIYENPKMNTTKIGEATPDEFAFNIAGCILHKYPHADKYCPVYWQYVFKGQQPDLTQMFDKYYAYSAGGNYSTPDQKHTYNELIKYYFTHAGLSNPELLKDKKDYLPERIKM